MQIVQMVVTGNFSSPTESREAINKSMRYFKTHGLQVVQVSDVPGVTQQEIEEARKTVDSLNYNY